MEGKVALSGAAGSIGAVLRDALRRRGWKLRSADLRQLQPRGADEDVCHGDLRDSNVVDALLRDADVLVHLAGTSVERPLDEIIENNLRALVSVYEGARRHGTRRIVFASSNHAIGMHPSRGGPRLRLDCDFRPDGFYGLSKMWGEGIARMYWDKHGIESICLRIGTCAPRPTEFRHLSTWLGHDDLVQLVECCLRARDIGFLVAWGVSGNDRSYWDNTQAARLGYRPSQNAEAFAAEILARPNPLDPVAQDYQGGAFVTLDYTPLEERKRRAL